tara:strand:+ start:683 stop:2026 length:1344 start_codon:yes stop_codon:yes gene_type:complete
MVRLLKLGKARISGRILSGLLCSFLSGLLFFLMVHFQLWFLIFFCFVPYFYYAYKEHSFLIPIFGALVFFFTSSGSLYWLYNYHPGFIYVVITLQVTFGFFLGSLFFLLNKKGRYLGHYKMLIFPLSWILLLFLYSFERYGNSWADYSFFYPMMSPIVLFIGSAGITFLIILTNSSLAYFFAYKSKLSLLFFIVLILLPVFCYGYSSYQMSTISGEETSFALIQGNFGGDLDLFIYNASLVLDSYEVLSREAADRNVDFIVWPEYAIFDDIFVRDELYLRISNLARELNTNIIFGGLTYVNKSEHTFKDLRYDTALGFSSEGEFIGSYKSLKPLSHDNLVVAGSVPSSFHVSGQTFVVGICSEEYFDSEVFDLDSDFMMILTDNADFDGTAGIQLIAQFARLRASEHKKYVIRAANTGLTEIIDPYGRVVLALPVGTSGILYGKIVI